MAAARAAVRACPATILSPHERATLASSATCTLRPTRCAISRGTLTDPAKGTRCAHLPQCNYKTLYEHIGRDKKCPIAGCAAPLQRSHDVKRDVALAAQLAQLPLSTARVWVRGAEVRTDVVATAQPAAQQRRSSQRCGRNTVVID